MKRDSKEKTILLGKVPYPFIHIIIFEQIYPQSNCLPLYHLALQIRNKAIQPHSLIQGITDLIPDLLPLAYNASVMGIKGSEASSADIDNACWAFAAYILSESDAMNGN